MSKLNGKCPKIIKEIFDDREMITPNLWLGVSICTQREADEKIPLLLQTPAVHHFINFEPLLENIDFRCPTCKGTGFYGDNRPGIKGNREYVACDICHNQKPGWVQLGPESGFGRRPMKLEWARNIVEQCKAAGVKIWIKQIEINGKIEKDMNKFPEDLKLRQWPF